MSTSIGSNAANHSRCDQENSQKRLKSSKRSSSPSALQQERETVIKHATMNRNTTHPLRVQAVSTKIRGSFASLGYFSSIRQEAKTKNLTIQENNQTSSVAVAQPQPHHTQLIDGPPSLEFSSEAHLTSLMSFLEEESTEIPPLLHHPQILPYSFMLHTHHSEDHQEATLSSTCQAVTFPKILSSCVYYTEGQRRHLRLIMKVVLHQLISGRQESCSKVITVHLPVSAENDEWGFLRLDSVGENGCIIGDGLHISRTVLERSLARAVENGVSKRVAPYMFNLLRARKTSRKKFGVYVIPELPRHVFVGPYVAEYLASRPDIQSLFSTIITTKTHPHNRMLIGSPTSSYDLLVANDLTSTNEGPEDDNSLTEQPHPGVEPETITPASIADEIFFAERQRPAIQPEFDKEHSSAAGDSVAIKATLNDSLQQELPTSRVDERSNVAVSTQEEKELSLENARTTQTPSEVQSRTADEEVYAPASPDIESSASSDDDILFLGQFPRVKSEQQFDEEALTEKAAFISDIEEVAETPVNYLASSPEILQQQGLLRDLETKEEKDALYKNFKYLEVTVAPEDSLTSPEYILKRAFNTIKHLEKLSKTMDKEYQSLLNQQRELLHQRDSLIAELPHKVLPLFTPFLTSHPFRLPERHTSYNENLISKQVFDGIFT